MLFVWCLQIWSVLTYDLSGHCPPWQGVVPIFEVGTSVGRVLFNMVVGDYEIYVIEGVPGILYILRV